MTGVRVLVVEDEESFADALEVGLHRSRELPVFEVVQIARTLSPFTLKSIQLLGDSWVVDR